MCETPSPKAVERDAVCSVLGGGGAEKETARPGRAACVCGSPQQGPGPESSALHRPGPSWHVSPFSSSLVIVLVPRARHGPLIPRRSCHLRSYVAGGPAVSIDSVCTWLFGPVP